MQETWVGFLIQEDPTCLGATKLVGHNYWACALEPRSCNYWAHSQQLLKPKCPGVLAWQQEKPLQWEAGAAMKTRHSQNLKNKIKIQHGQINKYSTLSDTMDCSLPDSSIYGIFLARVLEWVAISFSRSSQPRDWTRVSRFVGRCFTVWANRKIQINITKNLNRKREM